MAGLEPLPSLLDAKWERGAQRQLLLEIATDTFEHGGDSKSDYGVAGSSLSRRTSAAVNPKRKGGLYDGLSPLRGLLEGGLAGAYNLSLLEVKQEFRLGRLS